MGMPCQVNSIVKLNGTEFPTIIEINAVHKATKSGYRIFPIDVPLQLVDEAWCAHADVVITQLRWAGQQTVLEFHIHRIYDQPFALK
ncbi:MAG: DUF2584 domain-containing protein [Timaviella obliquedivisa GSE-PSE-MK23-08B]|jgi:hypothetical protein|nr:DUF2584 domain-containing protein [Timaviella obliquedivisa GSE-PSE-MK23-08B]